MEHSENLKIKVFFLKNTIDPRNIIHLNDNALRKVEITKLYEATNAIKTTINLNFHLLLRIQNPLTKIINNEN